MQTSRKFQLILSSAIFLFIFTACGLIDLATYKASPTPAGQAPTQPAETTPATALPQTTPAQPEPTQPPIEQPGDTTSTGFVVFKQDLEEFQVVDFNGEIQAHIAGKGFQAMSHDKVDVAGSNIYYFSDIDKKIFVANTSGLQVLPFQPPVEPYGFKISADETKIAWTVADWNSNPITSELWVANLDGSSPQMVVRASSDASPAFLLIPLEWTPDGRVLFNRSPTGFGGYILYGGGNSLYSYNPASQELVTYVPAEEMHGLCLDAYRLDLNLAAFNCTSSGPGITLRDLSGQAEKQLAPLADYPIAGSVRFSPSGAWLAYAAAKGNPEAEAGQLLVGPTDLSVEPTPIATLEHGYYYVQAWIDENNLLATRSIDMSAGTLVRLARDGSGLKELAEGWFVEMMP